MKVADMRDLGELRKLAIELRLNQDQRVCNQLRILSKYWDMDIAGMLRTYLIEKRNKIDFSDNPFAIPDRAEIKGVVPQGVVEGTQDFVYKVPLSLINRGVLTLGSIGTGKTTVTYMDVIELRKQSIPVIIFDFRNDYAPLSNYISENAAFLDVAKHLKINPIKPAHPLIERDSWRNLIANTICDCVNLHEASLSLLKDNFIEFEKKTSEKVRTFSNLVKFLENKEENLKRGSLKDKYTTLNTKIKGFANSMGEILNCQEGMLVDKIFNYGLVVLDLTSLGLIEKRFIYNYILGSKIMTSIVTGERGDKLRSVSVVDEAENFVGDLAFGTAWKIPEVITLLNFARDSGIGQYYAAHSISRLCSEAKQMAIIRTFRVRGIDDIRESASSMNIDWDRRAFVGTLPDKKFLISTPMFSQPTMLRSFEFVINNKIDKNQIELSAENFLKKVPYVKIDDSPIEITKVRTFIDKVETLTGDETLFLMDIDKNPYKEVKDRYQRLGFSAGKGTIIKQRVLNEGFLEESRITTGKKTGIRKMLNLTPKAYDNLKIPVKKHRGSQEHKYWVEQIEQYYKNKGYKVSTEYPISETGKCIDVYAWINTNGHDKIGVEVALSNYSSHEIENIKKCIEFGCNKVVLVTKEQRNQEWLKKATQRLLPESVMGKIEFKLAEEFTQNL